MKDDDNRLFPGSDPTPNRIDFCPRNEDKGRNGGIRVGWMRSAAALAGTDAYGRGHGAMRCVGAERRIGKVLLQFYAYV